MKRAHENQANDSDGAPGPSTSRMRPTKRSKQIQACTSCRKHKTRCEILEGVDEGAPVQCHRCKVVNTECSYGEMDRSLFQEYLKPPAVKESASSGGQSLSGSSSDAQASLRNTPGGHVIRGPDDVFPRPDDIWNFLGQQAGIDWSSPMVTIYDLVKIPLPSTVEHALPSAPADYSMESILTVEQTQDLLKVFEARYTPWLSFPLIRAGNNAILDLICCTVASRHLEGSLRSMVTPRLQKLTENTVIKMIFNPRSAESMESVQALLILSLWSPVYGSADSGIRDGRVLIASAVSMAMNLHLNEASTRVTVVHQPPGQDQPMSASDLENMDKARLWIALTNIESMLCVGTGRMPLSRRSPTDTQLIPHASSAPSTVKECRDIRLRISADMFDATEKGKTNALLSPASLDPWYDEAALILADMSRFERLLLPLPAVSDHDQFHFHMLMITLRTCRLLTIYEFMHNARMLYKGTNPGPFWFMEIRPRGIAVMSAWGKENLCLAEAILTDFLLADRSLIDTTPDNIFLMIGFAAGFLVGVKFLMVRNVGMELHGSSDRLLSRTLDLLSRIAFSNDHAAKRCAHLVHLMITAWERRHADGDVAASAAIPTPLTPGSDGVDTRHTPAHAQLYPQHSLPVPNASFAPEMQYHAGAADATLFMNSEIFQDADFWSFFLGAQETIPGGQ